MSKTWGEFIEAERKVADLSQAELAGRCPPGSGVHQARLSNWLHGTRMPSLRQAEAVYVALDLAPAKREYARALLVEDARASLHEDTAEVEAVVDSKAV